MQSETIHVQAKIKFFLISCLISLNIWSNSPSQSLNYGEGIIFTPSAHLLEEGTISFNYSSFGHIRNYRFTAYPFSWLSGSFFYADINSARYGAGMKQSFKDKGFSLKAKLLDKKNLGISFGLEDFAGTGHFDTEYIVLSFSNFNYDFSIGLGTGHIAGNSSFRNPLSRIDESFSNRRTGYKNFGGTPEYDKWFKGEIGLFAGLEIPLTLINGLTYKIEYEDFRNKANGKNIFNFFPTGKVNHGVSYSSGIVQIGAYSLGNDQPVFNISFTKNFNSEKKKVFNKPNIRSNLSIEDQVLQSLAENNVYLQKATVLSGQQEIEIEYMQSFNDDEKYASIDTFTFLRENFGFEKQTHTIRNGPVYLAEITYKNGEIVDRSSPSHQKQYDFNPRNIYPIFSYGFSPGYKNHIGSPAGFIFTELHLNFGSSIIFNKNLELTSVYTLPIYNNYENLQYDPAQTTAPPVRIEVQKYLRKGLNGPERFHLDYVNQYDDHHFLTSIGEFEFMYGGFRTEYLYKKFNSNHAIGFNINRAFKRDYKKTFFKYLDYAAWTGHIDYYFLEPSSRILTNISYGKYLAGDYGFTFDFSKRFKNGLVFGAFFSKTDMPLNQFGEGSFDKGVYISIPINAFYEQGKMTKGKYNEKYRPLTRDGAAKLDFGKRLHEVAFYRSHNNF